MHAQIAVNEVKAYSNSARDLKNQAVLIFKAFKSIYKQCKRLKGSSKNLTSIYQSLIKELEQVKARQAQGNIIDHQYYSALKNLQIALNYQKQAESRLAQIPSFEQQVSLLKQATEYLDYAFVCIIKSLKMLQKRK